MYVCIYMYIYAHIYYMYIYTHIYNIYIYIFLFLYMKISIYHNKLKNHNPQALKI